MPRTASQPSSTLRRSNGKGRPKTDGVGLQDERHLTSDRDERHRTSDRDERHRTSDRDEHTPRHEQGHTGDRNDQSGGVEVTQSGGVQRTVDDRTRSDRLRQPKDWTNPATYTASDTDAVAPVLSAWSQMFTPMFQFVGAMVEMQQKALVAMIGAANTNAGHSRDGEQGNQIDDTRSGSRTHSVGPDQNNDRDRSVSSTSTPRRRVSSTDTVSS